MPVPPPRSRVCLALVLLCWAWITPACGDAHWATTRWPTDRPGAPRQPLVELGELAIAVSQIDYGPDGVLVYLTIDNRGDARLAIERAAILLAYDELEYPVADPDPDHPEPARIELEPGTGVELRLRYSLGRMLSGPGSELVLRSLTRDGVALVELPRLRLPAMPI